MHFSGYLFSWLCVTLFTVVRFMQSICTLPLSVHSYTPFVHSDALFRSNTLFVHSPALCSPTLPLYTSTLYSDLHSLCTLPRSVQLYTSFVHTHALFSPPASICTPCTPTLSLYTPTLNALLRSLTTDTPPHSMLSYSLF